VASNSQEPGRVSPAVWTEDMDTGHSRLLTAGGHREAPARRNPAAPSDVGMLPAAQPAAECALGPSLESVGIGRRFTRTALRLWDMPGLCDQAELVVSELVTNAIRHGLLSARRTIEDYPIGLRLLSQVPFVTCMVTDPGGLMPVLAAADADAESGRGLHVVASTSLRWGWRPLEAGGKVVWALLRG
jgi:anti-sigma regulatory factor (Ser/Thr protein kinase)